MQGTEFCSQLCGNLLQQQWKNYERLKTPGPSDQLSDQLLSPEDTMRERTDISDHGPAGGCFGRREQCKVHKLFWILSLRSP